MRRMANLALEGAGSGVNQGSAPQAKEGTLEGLRDPGVSPSRDPNGDDSIEAAEL